MTTIGHHTCKKDGGEKHVLENAPFISTYDKEKDKMPFLGNGYYFWDYDFKKAKSWGVTHYGNDFFIVQSDLNMPDDEYLDLAGNRQHMEYFFKLLNRFARRNIGVEKWELGKFFEFIKEYRKHDNNIFPYNIIRAEDYGAYPRYDYDFFFNELKNYTNLSPIFIICFFAKKDIYLSNQEIVFKS